MDQRPMRWWMLLWIRILAGSWLWGHVLFCRQIPARTQNCFAFLLIPTRSSGWIPAPEQPPPSLCVRAGCAGWQQAEMPISAGPAVCQLPGQALAFLSPRAQLGSAVALGCGTGASFRAAGAFAKHHFSKQGFSCPLFLASINLANISKLAECSGDEGPPDSYFGGITVLQQDFFYKRGFFYVREMFSWNADLRSVLFDVAAVWVCSSCSCFPSVGAPVLHLFHQQGQC